MQRAGRVGDRRLNVALHLRTLAGELPFYRFRRLCDQLLEKMPGNVLTQADMLGENGIAFGPLDQMQKARI